jgi:hypothetical protein
MNVREPRRRRLARDDADSAQSVPQICQHVAGASPLHRYSIKHRERFDALVIVLTRLRHQSMSMCRIELSKADGPISGQAATASVHA